MRTRQAILTLVLAATAVTLAAQAQPRRATTITALRNYPGFYHQQVVLVVGEIKGTGRARDDRHR